MKLNEILSIFSPTILVVIILVSFFIIIVSLSKFRRNGEDEAGRGTMSGGYRLRYRLFNNSEASFFHCLIQTLPSGYYVFPKMRVADIVETLKGEGYTHRRNKVLPKHIDFVICDKDFKPRLTIEIDGASHRNLKVIERDRLKDEIFQSVGVPLRRVRVGANFSEEVARLLDLLR